MDSLEDALTKELNRLGNKDDSINMHHHQTLIRPITTGVLNLKTKSTSAHMVGIKSAADSYVDSSDLSQSSNIRPHAPIKAQGRRQQHSSEHSGSRSSGDDISRHSNKPKKNTANSSRGKKSQSITDLWHSLQHFSQNNLGRELNSQVMLSHLTLYTH
jgi:hypothetical protein